MMVLFSFGPFGDVCVTNAAPYEFDCNYSA
jgi:hypothetical protein